MKASSNYWIFLFSLLGDIFLCSCHCHNKKDFFLLLYGIIVSLSKRNSSRDRLSSGDRDEKKLGVICESIFLFRFPIGLSCVLRRRKLPSLVPKKKYFRRTPADGGRSKAKESRNVHGDGMFKIIVQPVNVDTLLFHLYYERTHTHPTRLCSIHSTATFFPRAERRGERRPSILPLPSQSNDAEDEFLPATGRRNLPKVLWYKYEFVIYLFSFRGQI